MDFQNTAERVALVGNRCLLLARHFAANDGDITESDEAEDERGESCADLQDVEIRGYVLLLRRARALGQSPSSPRKSKLDSASSNFVMDGS